MPIFPVLVILVLSVPAVLKTTSIGSIVPMKLEVAFTDVLPFTDQELVAIVSSNGLSQFKSIHFKGVIFTLKARSILGLMFPL